MFAVSRHYITDTFSHAQVVDLSLLDLLTENRHCLLLPKLSSHHRSTYVHVVLVRLLTLPEYRRPLEVPSENVVEIVEGL